MRFPYLKIINSATEDTEITEKSPLVIPAGAVIQNRSRIAWIPAFTGTKKSF
jgi:hypothetical protein